MHEIKLSDKTVVLAELNGNNYLPKKPVDKNTFAGKLKNIVITDEEGNVSELNDCKVIFAKVGNTPSFILLEKTPAEIEKEYIENLIADITEIVLMGGA